MSALTAHALPTSEKGSPILHQNRKQMCTSSSFGEIKCHTSLTAIPNALRLVARSHTVRPVPAATGLHVYTGTGTWETV